jgi:hypothetical protein
MRTSTRIVRAVQPLKLAFRKHAQQLGPKFQRRAADLIGKQLTLICKRFFKHRNKDLIKLCNIEERHRGIEGFILTVYVGVSIGADTWIVVLTNSGSR